MPNSLLPSPRASRFLRIPLLYLGLAIALHGEAASEKAIPSGTYRILTGQSKVSFTVTKWSMFKIEGQFHKHRGEIQFNALAPERSRVVWEIDAASVSTGEANRDESLRSSGFLDVKRHPTLRFESTAVKVGQGQALEVEGLLTIRGIQHPLVASVRLLGGREIPGEGYLAAFSTEFTIDRRVFGVLGGTMSRQMIGNEISVSLSAGAVKER